MHEIEPAVRFHVEDQFELTHLLIWQEVTAFNARGVQKDVDTAAALADPLDYGCNSRRVREVHREVMRCPSGCAYGIDCAPGRLRSLERGQFFLDQRGRGPLTTRLDTRKQ